MGMFAAMTAVGGLNAGLSGFGAYEQGEAASKASWYNAQVAQQNSKVALQNMAIAGQAGEAQAGISEQRTRATQGSIKANEAASGVDVNTGSSVQTQMSESELGKLDALTVRSNATKEAYGYQVQSENFKAQSTLDEFESKQDTEAAEIGGASTFLGSLSSSASNFVKYQLAGGFGG